MANSGQVFFGFLAGLEIHPAGQPVQKPADDLHVGGPDAPGSLGFSGRGQQRRQAFAGQGPPPAEIGRLGHPPVGFAAGDVQPIRQRPGQPAAQLGFVGLLGELIDQRMMRRPASGGAPSPSVRASPTAPGGQRVERQLARAAHDSIERVEDLDDLLAATRKHVRMLQRPTDKEIFETKVAHVISASASPSVTDRY